MDELAFLIRVLVTGLVRLVRWQSHDKGSAKLHAQTPKEFGSLASEPPVAAATAGR